MKCLKQLSALFLLTIFFTSCKKETPDEEFPVNTNFVSATFIGTLTTSKLEAKALKSEFAIFAPLVKYDVDYYKMIYKTNYKGNEIQVSGLVGIPKNVSKTPSLLSVHHAEITRFADAPSNFPVSFNGIELFASAGFIEMIPDYIGLGVSSKISHPYYHPEYSSHTVIDMIKATKYFLERKKISYSPRLYMTGFGEGGYVTARTQYELDTDTTHNLSVTASAEGGGILGISAYFQITSAKYIRPPFFIPMLLKGFYATDDWKLPLTEYLSPAYASAVPELFDGTRTTAEIDAEISRSPDFSLNPAFAEFNYFSPTYPEFKSTFSGGIPYSNRGYAPKGQTRFYFDTAIPVTSTIMVVPLDNFVGPKYSHITFHGVDRAVPSTGRPMLLNVMQWFMELEK